MLKLTQDASSWKEHAYVLTANKEAVDTDRKIIVPDAMAPRPRESPRHANGGCARVKRTDRDAVCDRLEGIVKESE